jgi:RimJ/RimL family protein N-acetyltransferase
MAYLIPASRETERLILRTFKEDDWRDLHDYYSDPECTKYTSGKPMADWESWRKLASLIGHWQMRNYGCYALEEKLSGKVIGIAGFEFPHGWPEPEIQWGLSRHYWGKGYAGEAVRAVKNIARKFLPDLRLISIIHPKNINSIHLAKSVGAHFNREYLFRDDTWHIYRH